MNATVKVNAIVRFIIENSNVSLNWNKKFYTTSEGQTSIYISNNKIDITELYNDCKDSKGNIYVSQITELYDFVCDNLYDSIFELEDKKITEIQFNEIKQNILNTLLS